MEKRSLKKLVFVTLLLMGMSLSTKVDASNQGAYIKDGSIIQVTQKNYEMWQNFGWKHKNNTTNVYNRTFEARGRYQHKNGQTYYSLFDSKGSWYGYLNSKATKKTSKQGNYISDGSYVKITKQNYEMWQSFSWSLKNNTNNVYGQIFQAKGRYQHFNGSTYYSLYDNKGTWYGYLNASATQKTNAQGSYISDGHYIKITKKNYTIWQNFKWVKRSNSSNYYGQSLQAKGKYVHFNGSIYYSLFDDKGNWIGYLNDTATEDYKPTYKEIKKVINKEQGTNNILKSVKGYEKISEETDQGRMVTKPNGDREFIITTTRIWQIDPNTYDFKARRTKENELFVGEWRPAGSDGMYTAYSGIGDSGMTFPTVYDANLWATYHIPEDKHSWMTWEVLMNSNKKVRITVHFFINND
ncbi:MAG: hypothetical protein RR557_07060 [Bacilli bacterium]